MGLVKYRILFFLGGGILRAFLIVVIKYVQPHKIPLYFLVCSHTSPTLLLRFSYDTIFTSLQDQTDKPLVFFSYGLRSIK